MAIKKSQTTAAYQEYPRITDELLGEVVRRIREAGNPLQILLFGSHARGENRPNSDLDLLVVEDAGRSRREAAVAYRLALLGSFPSKDIVVRTPQEMEARSTAPGSLEQQALIEGRVLFERGDTDSRPSGQMQPELKHAQRWFRKAESDLANARRTTASEGPYDTACFHAQQAAEKYLKGFLVSQGQSVPRTHDLEELALQADEVTPLGLSLPQLAELSYYAVEVRYDLDMWPEQEIAQRETEIAERVKAAVLVHVPGEAHP